MIPINLNSNEAAAEQIQFLNRVQCRTKKGRETHTRARAHTNQTKQMSSHVCRATNATKHVFKIIVVGICGAHLLFFLFSLFPPFPPRLFTDDDDQLRYGKRCCRRCCRMMQRTMLLLRGREIMYLTYKLQCLKERERNRDRAREKVQLINNVISSSLPPLPSPFASLDHRGRYTDSPLPDIQNVGTCLSMILIS